MVSNCLPNALSAAAITSETSSKNPIVATSPRLAARALTRPDSPVLGSAFQMAFSADCISPNTPLAVTSNVPKPMTLAQIPLWRSPALAIIA